MPSRRLPILLAAASLLALAGAGCTADTDSGLNARADGNLEKTDTIPAQNSIKGATTDNPNVQVQILK